MQYRVFHKKNPLYNSKDHGIPQNRPRVYIVAILESFARYDYKKPRKVKAPPIQHFLDPATRTDQPGALPPRGKTRFGALAIGMWRGLTNVHRVKTSTR